jgi:hypothetical protein
MMRKASKKTIAANLANWRPYREKLEKRRDAITAEGAASAISGMIEDAESRILAGDIGYSTEALISSIVRIIKNFESGLYVSATEDGQGFNLAKFNS